MAEGKSNQGIADALFITEAAVEKHVTSIFHKLELGPTPSEHRRVLRRADLPQRLSGTAAETTRRPSSAAAMR